jgi:hypothetical protein
LEEENTTQGRGRRRRIVVVLAACVLVGIGVVAFWPGEREPEYNGKKLSEWVWMERHTPPENEEAKVAAEAVRHIGTNALPSVLRWIGYKRPYWKTIVFNCASKMPRALSGATYWVINRTFVSDDKEISRVDLGIWCLRILGPEAEPAIPELVRMTNQQDSEMAQSAFAGLFQIGLKSVRPLAQIIDDPTHRHRDMAVGTLYMFGEYARPTVPVLLRACSDSDLMVRDGATNALLRIAPEVLTNGTTEVSR